MSDVEQLAASGDINAQRQMVEYVLVTADDGICSAYDALEHALWWARLAERRAEVLGRDPFWRKATLPNFDTWRLFKVLEKCVAYFGRVEDWPRYELYFAETIAVIDDLADRGDAGAQAAMANLPESVSAKILKMAKPLRALRRERLDRGCA